MSTRKNYTKELNQELGFLATWLPSFSFNVGDIVEKESDGFRKVGDLSLLSIPFTLKEESINDIVYKSKGVVISSNTTSADVSPINAGLVIKFIKENSILFNTQKTSVVRIENQILLKDTVLKKYKSKDWNKDWIIITELIRAEYGTIVISSSSNGEMQLNAKVKINIPGLNVADPTLGLSSSFENNIDFSVVGEKSLTPLFKAYKVKSFWGGSFPSIGGLKRGILGESIVDDITKYNNKEQIEIKEEVSFEKIDFDDLFDDEGIAGACIGYLP